MFTTSFYLRPKPPFRLDLTVWVLRRLPHNIIDRWDGETYSRILVFQDDPVKIDITQPNPERINITINTNSRSLAGVKETITTTIEKLLGIRKDVSGFYAVASRETYIKPLMSRFMGVKPPQYPSLFEAVMNAIACQQVSLNVGITLLNRMAQRYGKTWIDSNGAQYAFPEPANVAKAKRTDLRSIGFSGNKAEAIIDISGSVAAGRVHLERIAEFDNSKALQYLADLKGLGPWSAEYVLLRGLGRTEIFPGDDAGARNSLVQLLGLAGKPDLLSTRKITARWHPFAGFVYFHFLLNRLQKKGYI